MSVTPCPDCGKPVSDSAPACPHCGRAGFLTRSRGCGDLLLYGLLLLIAIPILLFLLALLF